jgi:predicted permease
MLHDVRSGIRNLRHNRLIGAVAVLALGLGIGAATAVFSVVDAVLLQPLPFHDPRQLVRIHALTPDGDPFSFADADYLDLRSSARGFEGIAAFREIGTSRVITSGGEAERIAAVPMSATAAAVLGVPPVLGRFFAAEEDRPGAEGRVVLGHGLWQRRFGGDPAIVGRPVLLDDRTFVVTGVMPPGFDFPAAADAWVPLGADAARSRDDKELAVFARLAPGTTSAGARAEIEAFARRLAEAHPAVNAGRSAGVLPFGNWLVAPRFQRAVWVLFGAVALLLLLACANVATLLIAHATTRQTEMRIRAALGASQFRLRRLLFTESALLAALGTGAGVLIAFWSVDAVRALGAGRVPRLDAVEVNAAVLRFACLAGIVSCLVFGSAPAVRGARAALGGMADGGTRYTGSSRRLRHVLVAAEVALALMLVVGASLLTSSFVRLMRVDPGFDPAGVVQLSIDLPSLRYPGARVSPFYGDLLERVRALPGVTAAGATSTDPFRALGFSNTVTPEERAHEAPAGLLQAGWRSVTPGFFEAMRIPVLAGRTFDAGDRADSPRVVLVSRSLAGRLWPGHDAVGKRIYWGGTGGRTRTVVGVTEDIRDVRLDREAPPMLFVPHAQVDLPTMTLVVRTSLAQAGLAPALRSVLREMDAALPAPEVIALDAALAASSAGARFNLWLLGVVAAIALALAITGVYATMAFTVAERRREMAVRLALGASPRQIVRLIVRVGLGVAIAGIVAGTALALASTKVLATLLYDVAPTDPGSFGASAVVLLAAAALACYLPARRAANLDPSGVLRD